MPTFSFFFPNLIFIFSKIANALSCEFVHAYTCTILCVHVDKRQKGVNIERSVYKEYTSVKYT